MHSIVSIFQHFNVFSLLVILYERYDDFQFMFFKFMRTETTKFLQSYGSDFVIYTASHFTEILFYQFDDVLDFKFSMFYYSFGENINCDGYCTAKCSWNEFNNANDHYNCDSSPDDLFPYVDTQTKLSSYLCNSGFEFSDTHSVQYVPVEHINL